MTKDALVRLVHVNVLLWERNADTGLIQFFFDVFSHSEIDSPVVCSLSPDTNGEVHGAVSKLAHLDEWFRVLENFFMAISRNKININLRIL